jgi:hypothetical protein
MMSLAIILFVILLVCLSYAAAFSLPSTSGALKAIPKQSFKHRRLSPRQLGMILTDKMPKPKLAESSGMFTNSSPETKRVLPRSSTGKVKFKIVYVVLESQYQSALTDACHSINNGNETVCVEAVGYLLEELRNPAVLEMFKEDVATANIFIGSLIFVQELADKVSVGYARGAV